MTKRPLPSLVSYSRQVLLALGVSSLLLTGSSIVAAEASGEFSKPVIDLGMVVKDAARTAQFLTNAIGFKELQGFPVTADVGKRIGLIDGYATQVRVFVLEDVELATRIKVLSFPEASSKQPDQSTIHATLGMRYLTLFVKDMNRAVERLKKAKISPLGETPMDLGGGTFITVVKDPDGNFVELIGPMKK